jgi:hypothetical protein
MQSFRVEILLNLKTFYPIDSNPKDNYVSKEELDWYVTTMRFAWDFDLLDNDGDGKISLEEWMVNATEAFGKTYRFNNLLNTRLLHLTGF